MNPDFAFVKALLNLVAGLLIATLASHSTADEMHEHQNTLDNIQDEGTSSIFNFNKITVGNLSFENFKARASIGNSQNSAVYGEVTISRDSDILITASSSASKLAELHRHVHDNGVLRMRHAADGFSVSKEKSLILKPGSKHIMLIGLVRPLTEDSNLDVKLDFASGVTVILTIPVVNAKKFIPTH